MVSFNSIPVDIRTFGTYIEFDNSRAVQGLPGQPNKALIIGQKLAAGTMPALTPTLITSAGPGEVLAGRGSVLSKMITAFKNANADTELWAIALDDSGSGVAATSTLTVTGPATASGAVYLYINGNRIQVSVASGDTATAIATNIVTEIGNNTALSVTAANTAGVVTLTAQNKGAVGNQTTVQTNYNQGEALPAGVGVAVVAPNGGTTDPVLANALAAMGDVQYNTIVTHLNDATSLTALEGELANRWGPMTQLEGQGFVGVNDTLSNTATFGTARNSQFLTIVGGGLSPTPPYVWASVAGAVDAGEPDPARPRQTLALPGVLPPPPALRFTRTERSTLLHDGVATYIVDAGGNVLVERLITAYRLNAQGIADISYLDIETMRTLAYLRYSLRARVSSRYPRCKLADDGTSFGPGQAIVTPSILRADFIALAREWEAAGLVENVDKFKDQIIVVRSSTDPNRVDAVFPPDLVNQFRVLAGQIQFIL